MDDISSKENIILSLEFPTYGSFHTLPGDNIKWLDILYKWYTLK